VTLRDGVDGKRRFCVLFDPLDGSSNLDVCGGVGTIFSIVRHDRRAKGPEQSVLQPGSQQVAAGYILYGPSTVFTLTLGNEGNRLKFPQGYSARYAGAMVADVHRILLKGGVFLYPPTEKAPNGKLRLLYEANPMSMLIEQAGGMAMAGPGQRLLEIVPTEVHQRTPVIMGSTEEVERVLGFI
jgi:fructose-1,6-bisphosphatase I